MMTGPRTQKTSGHGAQPPEESLQQLRNAIEANRMAYEEACRPGSGCRVWDYCIVTAANRRQARGYRIELERRRARRLIPAATRVLVVHDPGGRRIGSGAATLNVLRVVAKDLVSRLRAAGLTPRSVASLFENRRILVIHSGGDSKRIPHYSSYGKIFATIPRPLASGWPSTVFDELMIALARFPARMDEGMLVASGDVLMAFDPQGVNLRWPGVTGIALRVPWRMGTRHGVYVQSRDATHVRDFLQKPSKTQLDAHGAIDARGQVLLDSGLVRFDAEELMVLADLAGIHLERGRLRAGGGILGSAARAGMLIDLYDEILRPLAPGTTEQEYLAVPDRRAQRVRAEIWHALRHIPFRVCAISPARLLHMGTTHEFRRLVTRDEEVARLYDFWNNIDSYVAAGRRPPGNACIVSSTLTGTSGRIGSGCVIEHSCLDGEYRIGAGAIVCGVENRGRSFYVAPGVVAHEVLIRRHGRSTSTAKVLRIYGVVDDPKLPVGGGKATLFGVEFRRWLRDRGIPQTRVWPHVPPAERSLWNAKLYPAINERAGYDIVMWMQDGSRPDSRLLERWLRAERYSLEDTFEYADCKAIAAARDTAKTRRCEIELEHLLPLDRDCSAVWRRLDSPNAFADAVRFVRSWTKRRRDPLLRMRGYKIISDILGSGEFRAALHGWAPAVTPRQTAGVPPQREAEAWRIMASRPRDIIVYDALARFYFDEAFAQVREAVRKGVRPVSLRPKVRVKPGEELVIDAPARIDFGGGWSDTPPYSLRCGGTVLNAAIRLNGRCPVRATVKILDEPQLRLISRDAGYELTTTSREEVLHYENPSDPVALLKAALCCVGIVTPRGRESLEVRLAKLGGGLEICTESRVPKGSGLGTSSIIAAALVRALFRLVGEDPSDADLFAHVSYVEQMVSTGGGWQDQIGAIVPGIKLIETVPGYEQRPRITSARLSEATCRELNRRLVLVYTGERRLAKDILQSIMGKYMSGEEGTVRILSEIQVIARAMKRALERGSLEEFGELMARHWELNKQLDPQSSTQRIERILDVARPHALGAKMVGAGGGGFMMIVGRDAASRRRIARLLRQNLADEGVSVWDWELVE